MEFGLQINNKDFQELRDFAQAAEELGYSLITVPDHIIYEEVGGRFDPTTRSYDQMISVAVMLEATKRIRAGHLVLCNLFRHPIMTAQSLTTLDRLSGGRLVAGLGAGWTEREFRMSGIPFPPISTRLRMLDEALSCIRSLWTQEQTTFEGEFYQLREAILSPKPVQHPHPPILIGGSGRGILRVAGKHANIVNIISDVGKAGAITQQSLSQATEDAFKEKVRFVRDKLSKNGRKPDSIQISNVIFIPMLTGSTAEAESTARAVAGGIGMSPDQIRRSPLALIGTAEQCTAELGRRAKEWGVSQFIFSGALDLKTIQRLAKEVFPHISK